MTVEPTRCREASPGPDGPGGGTGSSGLEAALADYLAGADLDAEIAGLTLHTVPPPWLVELSCPAGTAPMQDVLVMHDVLDADLVRSTMAGLTALGLPAHVAEQILTLAGGLTRSQAWADDGPNLTPGASGPRSPRVADPGSARPPDRDGGPGAATAQSVRDQRLLDGVEAALLLSRWTDAAMLDMTRGMAVAAGEEILAQDGYLFPDELSKTRRERWRARTKSAVATELQALTGWGIGTCHSRVGLALAPRAVAARAEWALGQGWNDARAVFDFWKRARNLPVDQAELISDRVFGPVPDGAGAAARASHAEFTEALGRAETAVLGSDACVARKRRRDALAARTVSSVIDGIGVGTVSIDGSTSAVAAAVLRLDSVARKARHCGDERTISQLRADLALALLTHGTLPDAKGAEGADLVAEPGEVLRSTLGRFSTPVSLEVIVPLDALVDPDSRAIAEIPGVGYLTAEHVREIAAAPGTTLHRLLTDPADGRCLERSIGSYTPDRAMVDQLRAADRTCRGPGCTRDVRHAQLDHETPFDAGGPTSEANLAFKHSWHHNNKTLGLWSSALAADRTITWTTLFGRVYTTRSHDYRTLYPLGGPTTTEGVVAPALAEAQQDPALADRLIYAALAHRNPGEGRLADDCDDPDLCAMAEMPTRSELSSVPGWVEPLLGLRHHTPGGAVRRGAPKDQPTVRDILHPVPETLPDRPARASAPPPPF